jgi:hypothetical protein
MVVLPVGPSMVVLPVGTFLPYRGREYCSYFISNIVWFLYAHYVHVFFFHYFQKIVRSYSGVLQVYLRAFQMCSKSV